MLKRVSEWIKDIAASVGVEVGLLVAAGLLVWLFSSFS